MGTIVNYKCTDKGILHIVIEIPVRDFTEAAAPHIEKGMDASEAVALALSLHLEYACVGVVEDMTYNMRKEKLN